jgi:membrane-bound inhibitor of C-type lysozyme
MASKFPAELAAVTLGIGVLVAGCAHEKEPVYRTFYYRCPDTSRFTVKELDKNRVELKRGVNRYTLKPVEAGGGKKYASDVASFSDRGEEVDFEVKGKAYTGCKLDNVQSSDEAIRELQIRLPTDSGGAQKR